MLGVPWQCETPLTLGSGTSVIHALWYLSDTCAPSAGYFCLQWSPSLKGYLQFLAESEVVYKTFEDIMTEASHPECELVLAVWLLFYSNMCTAEQQLRVQQQQQQHVCVAAGLRLHTRMLMCALHA